MVDAAGDGDGFRLVVTARRTAEILEGEGRWDEAIAMFATALAESTRTGERTNRSEILGHLAVNLLRVGRTEEAEPYAAEGAAVILGPADVAANAEADWVRGHVLAARGDDEAADAAFRAAIAGASRGEFVPLHVSLRLDHAEFLLARGRGAEAAALLAEAERLAPPPPWNHLPARRRALAAAARPIPS
jgi:tetratricopeptide (TPR) repeat protein